MIHAAKERRLEFSYTVKGVEVKCLQLYMPEHEVDIMITDNDHVAKCVYRRRYEDRCVSETWDFIGWIN